MRHAAETLAKAAQSLTAEEQTDLIDRLLTPASASEWDHAWAVECDTRIGDIENGKADLIDADAVLAKGRRWLAVRRRAE